MKSVRFPSAVAWAILMKYYTWFIFAGIYFASAFFFSLLLEPATFFSILIQGTTVGFLAIGMTFVMLIGEIDLSIVSVAAFGPLMGTYALNIGLHPVAAILLAILVGIGVGLINGLLVTKFRVPSLVQTVSMWWILSGIVLILTEGKTKAGFPEAWTWLGKASIGPIQMLVLFFVTVVVIAVLFARRTVIGERLYVVGGNREAARSMGIPVDRIRTIAFILSGLFGALGGYVLSARLGFVSSRFAVEWLMPAIAAPVIAGVSLTGGRGNLINVVAGAYLTQLMVMIARVGGLTGYYYDFVQGVLVFIAILIDTVRRRIVAK